MRGKGRENEQKMGKGKRGRGAEKKVTKKDSPAELTKRWD